MSGAPKVKDWQCLECGRKMTARAAERAVNGNGCPKCGGVDIDLAPVTVSGRTSAAESTYRASLDDISRASYDAAIAKVRA